MRPESGTEPCLELRAGQPVLLHLEEVRPPCRARIGSVTSCAIANLKRSLEALPFATSLGILKSETRYTRPCIANRPNSFFAETVLVCYHLLVEAWPFAQASTVWLSEYQTYTLNRRTPKPWLDPKS